MNVVPILSVRRADPAKDYETMAPMVTLFAKEIGLADTETEKLLKMIGASISFVAYDNGNPVGLIGMMEDESAFWGQYLWVDPSYRNRSVAGVLHRAAFRHCAGKPARIIVPAARKNMYERIGYTTTYYVLEKKT